MAIRRRKGIINLRKRYQDILQDIREITQIQVGRPTPKLVAVSKTYPVEDIQILYEEGQRDFGENRVMELKDKALFFSQLKGYGDIRWHFLGALQSNKMKTLLSIPRLSYIHSVDSLDRLRTLFSWEAKLSGEANANANKIGLFFQVNTSGEEEKQGFEDFTELKEAVRTILFSQSRRFSLTGLMTMGKIRSDDILKDADICFAKLRETKDRLEKEFDHLKPSLSLSMGMSQDYPLAVKHGADYLRIGTQIFGERS